MFSLIPKQKTNNDSNIIILIKGDEVAVSISKNNNGIGNIIYYHRNKNDLGEFAGQKRVESMVVNNIKYSVEKIIKDFFPKLVKDKEPLPAKISVILGSPWIKNSRESIKISKDKNFLVTHDLISKEIQETVKVNDQEEIIERFTNSIKANGYNIIDLVGKKTSNIEVDIFNTVVDKNFKEKIEEIISLYLPIRKISFHSLFFILTGLTRNLLKIENATLFLPDNEVTEILSIKDGSIENSISIPFGKNRIIRNIAFTSKQSIKTTKSKINLFLSNQLKEEEDLKIKSYIKNASTEFQTILKEYLLSNKTNIGDVGKIIIVDNEKETEKLWTEILDDKSIKEYTSSDSLLFLEEKDFVNNVGKGIKGLGESIGHVDTGTLSTVFYLANL